jgi:hypothetical protein
MDKYKFFWEPGYNMPATRQDKEKEKEKGVQAEGGEKTISAEEAEGMARYIIELENRLKEAELQEKQRAEQRAKPTPPQPQQQAVKSTTVKLPDFWSSDVALWFKQCEAVFASAGIVEQEHKFNAIVGKLPPAVAVSCRSLLMEIDPAYDEDPYKRLRAHMLLCFGRTDWQLAFALMDSPSLGDRRPSQMLQDMRALLPRGEQEGKFFQAHFIRRLPAKVADLILATDFENADEMAAAADRMVHAPETAPPAVAAVTEAEPPRCCNVNKAKDRPSRSGSKKPGDKKRSQTPAAKDKKHCWYHWKYGKDSTRCKSPCSWEPEN